MNNNENDLFVVKDENKQNSNVLGKIILYIGIIEFIALIISYIIYIFKKIPESIIELFIPTIFGLILPYVITKNDGNKFKNIYLLIMLVSHICLAVYGLHSFFAPCNGIECLNRLGILIPFIVSIPLFIIITPIYLLIRNKKN